MRVLTFWWPPLSGLPSYRAWQGVWSTFTDVSWERITSTFYFEIWAVRYATSKPQ